jgi:hypothetical protein
LNCFLIKQKIKKGNCILKFSVFISHSSKDAALATELCRLLEAHSITCWIAPRNIASGTSYGEGIAKAIEQVSVVLLLLTQPVFLMH